MSTKDEEKNGNQKTFYYLESQLVSRIFSKFEEIIERIHELERDRDVKDYRLKSYKKEVRSLEEDLREEIRFLKEQVESQDFLRKNKKTDLELVKNNLWWVITLLGFIAYAFKDYVFRKIGLR